MHGSGQQLGQVSGVEAILRYPLPDLDELELEYEAAMEAKNNDADNVDFEDSDSDDECLERVKEELELMDF